MVSHPTNKEQLWVSPQYAKIIKKIAVDVGKGTQTLPTRC
jgi:hypothetical protein